MESGARVQFLHLGEENPSSSQFTVQIMSEHPASPLDNSAHQNTIRLPWRLSGKDSASQCRYWFSPQSRKIPLATEKLSLRTATMEPVLQSLRAVTTEAHAQQQGSPATRSLSHCNQRAGALLKLQPEQSLEATKTQQSQQINAIIYKTQ